MEPSVSFQGDPESPFKKQFESLQVKRSNQQKEHNAQMLKDMSFVLFMGASLDAKYKNIVIAERNKKIVEFFSKPIS